MTVAGQCHPLPMHSPATCAMLPVRHSRRQIRPAARKRGTTEMNDIAERRAEAGVARDLWQSIPLECILSAVFVFAAAGLTLAGVFP